MGHGEVAKSLHIVRLGKMYAGNHQQPFDQILGCLLAKICCRPFCRILIGEAETTNPCIFLGY